MTPGEASISTVRAGQVLLLVPNNTSRSLAEARHYLDSASQGPIRAPGVDVLSLWAGKTLQRLQLLGGEPARLVPPRFVLTALWEQAITERDGADWSPGDISATAREALEAERLLKHWIETADSPGQAETPWLGTAFFYWRRKVHAVMDREGWIDSASQLLALVQRLEAGVTWPGVLPAEVRLRGFVECTVLEQRLFDALQAQGVRVVDENTLESEAGAIEHGSAPSINPDGMLFRSIEDELRHAADWAARQVESGSRRVAVAVNGFEALHDAALNAFLHRFEPKAALGLASASGAQFHLQGGTPLARHPLVPAMFDLLELSRSGVRRAQPFGLLSRWLLSPAWCGADEEAPARARLELCLRRAGRAEFSLVDVAREAEGLECPVLVERIARLPEAGAEGGAARQFMAWLEHWGWPGPLAGAKDELIAVEGVRSALDALDAAAIDEPGAALSALRAQCQDRRIAGPGGSLSPVQVLDVRDLAGERFDAVRIVNVHAENWPEPPRTNRLLPFGVSLRLPGGDSASQQRRTRALQEAVLRASGSIVVSRAAQVDGVPTAPSSTLPVAEGDAGSASPHTVPGGVLARFAWPDAGSIQALDRDRLSAIGRKNAPPVPHSDERLVGAVRLLNTQSACPWAAFLVHRLDAVFPAWPSSFPDQAFTGNLVHEALRQLYRDHLGDGRLPGEDEVPGAVRKALNAVFAEHVFAPAVRAAETRRLEQLLCEWLRYERALPWPAPVALEEQREAEFSGFRLGIRIDRVDHAAHGVLILDYKTGSTSAPDWSSQRPTDIQLPLYAVLLSDAPQPPVGIGLLTVRANEMAQMLWTGEAEARGRGVTVMGQGRAAFPDWPAAVAHWRQTLAALVAEYQAGHVALEVHHERPLRYLGLDPLLRVDSGRIDEALGHD